MLLYDGVCGICNRTVQTILRFDRAGTLRFAALDSDFAREIIDRHPGLEVIDSFVFVDDPGVSRHHAEVRIGNDIILRDLGSTNGTYVNGTLIAEHPLRDGAIITIGSTNLTFRSAT